MTAEGDALAAARARVDAFRAELQAAQARPVELIETHISWVLLAAQEAYKFKKPLALPFADFTSLAARRRYCEEELWLNGRLAPALYEGVLELKGDDGRVLDVAVRMRRFADDALWSRRVAAHTLTPQHADALAERLVAFHRDAAAAPADCAFGTRAAHEQVLTRLVAGIDAWDAAQPAPSADWPALRSWLQAQPAALAPLWQARLAAGRVREGHGDLHLANLLVLDDGEVGAFDGIEFDPALRWIDVLEDIAFVVMDLAAHGEPGLAMRFLSAWLDAGGDHDGLPMLRYALAERALVRAQVAAIGQAQGRAAPPGLATADYLARAVRWSRAGRPWLAITHGLPGSGKSYWSQRLLAAAGALRLRSDVERKRLFGLGALDSSRAVAGGIYGGDATARTYARLLDLARGTLAAGWPVIIDAAFLRAAERQAFAALAHAAGVPFAIIDCRAPLATLESRLAQRQAQGGDASEADGGVLHRLLDQGEPLSEGERAHAVEAADDAIDGLARRLQPA